MILPRHGHPFCESLSSAIPPGFRNTLFFLRRTSSVWGIRKESNEVTRVGVASCSGSISPQYATLSFHDLLSLSLKYISLPLFLLLIVCIFIRLNETTSFFRCNHVRERHCACTSERARASRTCHGKTDGGNCWMRTKLARELFLGYCHNSKLYLSLYISFDVLSSTQFSAWRILEGGEKYLKVRKEYLGFYSNSHWQYSSLSYYINEISFRLIQSAKLAVLLWIFAVLQERVILVKKLNNNYVMYSQFLFISPLKCKGLLLRRK